MDINAVVNNSKKRVLLLFTATWCQPCKQLKKTLAHLLDNNPGIKKNILINELDIEEQSSQHLLIKHKITSVPTLILLDEQDKVIAIKTGNLQKLQLEQFLIQ